MRDYRIGEGEYQFLKVVWDNQPISSSDLVKICRELFDWKKSTTYTILKRLCEKGLLKNDNSRVTALTDRGKFEKYQSEKMVKNTFDGSLPKFIAAFMRDKKLSEKEREELKALIDNYKE